MKKITVLFSIFFCLFSANALADTHAAASCSSADVTTAITAAEAGDIVTVAGNCTWSETVTVNKPITIQGTWNGSTGTTLTASGAMGTDQNNSSAGGFFWVTGFNAATLCRITGFKFEMTDSTPKVAIKVSVLGTNSTSVRIDGNYFNEGNAHINIYTLVALIDNNEFHNWNGERAIEYEAEIGGSRTLQDSIWNTSLSAGGSDALFIENNKFYNDAAGYILDNNRSGKLVIRYNTIDYTDYTGQFDVLQNHGNDFGYWQNTSDSDTTRSLAILEMYNNSISGNRVGYLYTCRGGIFLVHDNKVTSSPNRTPSLVRMYDDEYSVTGDFNPLRTAYPPEDSVHNSFAWNNKGPTGSNITEWYNASLYTLNKDYFFQKPCGASDETDGEGNTCNHGSQSFTCAEGHESACNGSTNVAPTDGTTYHNYGQLTWTATGDNAHYPYTSYTCPHPIVDPTAALECDSAAQGTGVAGGYGLTKESTYYNVTLSITGSGTLSPGTTQSVISGGNGSAITATPINDAWNFTGWSGTCGCTGTGTCTATNVTGDCTVVGTFTSVKLLN